MLCYAIVAAVSNFSVGQKIKWKELYYCGFQAHWILRGGSWLVSGRAKYPVSLNTTATIEMNPCR